MIRLGRLRPIGNRELIGCSLGAHGGLVGGALVVSWVQEMNRQAEKWPILCLSVLVFRVLGPFSGPSGSFEGISLPVGPGWGNSTTVQPQPQTARDTLERMSP